MRWEAFHNRDFVIDTISTARQVFSITDQEQDMSIVLTGLFMEQRSGLRLALIKPKSKSDARDPSNLARAILIRSNIYVHLHNTFPEINDVIAEFMDGSCYTKYYGIDTRGAMIPSFVVNAEDTDDDMDKPTYASMPLTSQTIP